MAFGCVCASQRHTFCNLHGKITPEKRERARQGLDPVTGSEVAVVEEETPTAVALPTLVPQTTAQDLVERLAVIRGAMEQAMQKDIDYGVIPGTGKKPTLLKPGAEKLAVLFQMDVQIENEKLWDGEHLTVISRATVYHIPSGSRIASGEGMCSTKETKYAFRQSERVCPTCGVAAIIKGKEEYGGGYVCFKRKGGCGAKFTDTDPAITGQAVGQVPNPNIADTYNTVDKMASKRARIDAVLAATGASALFTQDVEDLPPQPGTVQHPEGQRVATPDPYPERDPVVDDGMFPPLPDVDMPAPKVISEAQRKRLRAIQNERGVSDDALKAIVLEVGGVESSKLIPVARYEAIVAAVEAVGAGHPEAAGFQLPPSMREQP